MPQPDDKLFTLRVAAPAPAKGRWNVVVRAPSEQAAVERVAARGNTVLSVKAGYQRPQNAAGMVRAVPACVACGYSLTDLPKEETLEVVCPECGTVNLGIELPDFSEKLDRKRSVRLVKMFLYGTVAAVVLLAGLLLFR